MHYSFDFDYTLADSAEGSVVCVSHALSNMGYVPPVPEAIRRTVGLSLPRTFEQLTGETDEGLAEQFKGLFLTHADEVMLDHIRLYDVAPQLLRHLVAQQDYVSIVSTKYRHRIDQALQRDGLRHLVHDIVGGDCVTRHKPDPEGLLLAIERSGIPRDQTVYVGDSASDGGCADQAGVAFIATLTGVTTEDELRRWNPVRVINSVADLITSQQGRNSN